MDLETTIFTLCVDLTRASHVIVRLCGKFIRTCHLLQITKYTKPVLYQSC